MIVNPPVVASVWTIIASGQLSATAASIDITSITSGYKMFKLFVFCKSELSKDLLIRFNNDSTAGHYRWQRSRSQNGNSLDASNATNATELNCGTVSAVAFAAFDITISNSTTAITKCFCGIGGYCEPGANYLEYHFAGYFSDTNEISRITLLPSDGTSWSVGTRYVLMGC